MSETAQSYVWLNGALALTNLARIAPNDRGLTLGDGLFETIRATNGIPHHCRRHLARMHHGAAKLDIAVPFDDADILSAFAQTLNANRLDDAAVLRLTLTRGAGLRGLIPPANAQPTLLITASSLPASSPQITAAICRTTRRNEFSPLAAIKSLNALDNILARNEAVKEGAMEAILLNTQGDVAEASAANIFILTGGRWLTPRVADGALPGIFRSLVLTHNAASEARISEADLFAAQTICLGNALGVRAISSLNGRNIEMRQHEIGTLQSILHAEEK
jgi:branched-chain amino acid aminotransferase